jgi:hypothetical protein
MALIPGDSACTTGLSSELYTARHAIIDFTGVAPATQTICETALKADCYAMSTVICAHITAHGKAYIGTGLGALQQDSANANTTPPTAEREIPLR